ncbi:CBS domain-containing protein [Hydrogenophaga sp. PAMC20947]|nr:CBS domain-containing protein [Hydrogenophaga sp. PAMC20947]
MLPSAARDRLASAWDVHPLEAGQRFAIGVDFKLSLFWLLEGAVDLLDPDGRPLVALRTGDLFGLDQADSLLISAAQASSPGSVAQLPLSEVQALCQDTPALTCFLPPFAPAASESAGQHGGSGSDPALNLMTTPVRSLIKRAPIMLAPQTTIREAAELMREQRVSSVLIEQDQRLFGLVTDRDLRNRVVAAGMDTGRSIMDIATLAPLTMDVENPAFDALLLMARHNIHHVPVLDGHRIAGMITATDITERHSTSAVYLAGEVYKQNTVNGLQTAAARIKRLQQSLASAQASAYSTGHIITAITDAITSRLLQLGEAQLGPAPIDYVWVAAGSQARSEQTAKSDQDNCMVLDDSFNEAEHGAYFKALATFVCDGLDACGYIYCPGEMMAMTDTWRQPKRKWAEYFARWTGQPDPKSLMLTCVFFDLRAIYGKTTLLEGLRAEVLQRTQGNTLFLAHMVGNALQHQPPLGMFKGISTIRSGEHKGKIDMKHTGVVPIVDLARVYALAGAHEEVNTHDRLVSSAAQSAISEQSARDLRDALEFLAYTRIQHQARQIGAGQEPDNFLPLNVVSNFERSQLKDAFTVVHDLQNVLGQRYRM